MREFRPGSFQILPLIVKNLLIINLLVFLAQTQLGPEIGNFIDQNFALHSWQSPYFKLWQVVTYMFMHGGWSHIFFNMFALWMFGSVLENLWGPKRFLIFYMVCGLGAAFFHLLYMHFQVGELITDYTNLKANFNVGNFINFAAKYHLGNYSGNIMQLINAWQANPSDPSAANLAMRISSAYYDLVVNTGTLGASGAIFGILVAFGYLFPNTYLYFYFLVPIKAKWFVIGYIALELFLSIQNSPGDNVAHVAHLGGGLVGFILVYYWNRHNRQNFY